MNKVKVLGDAAGNVVIPSKNNAEWGNILVQEERIVVDDRGFARKKKVSALIAGLTKDLQSFGWKANQLIEGSVIIKESLEPFNAKDPERDYKVAGKTGIICTIEGHPIFSKNLYTTDPNAQDVFIRDEHGVRILHDNKDEIRAAYLKLAEEEKSEAVNESSAIGNM